MTRNNKLLGQLGVWLCNRYSRPLTECEKALDRQYVGLMIDVLGGKVSYYGRDAAPTPEEPAS